MKNTLGSGVDAALLNALATPLCAQTLFPAVYVMRAGGGARWVDNRIVEYPNEQVRLYKVVEPDARASDL